MVNVTILIFNCQFPILDGDVSRSTPYGVYISQLIRFARASSHVADVNTRNKLLTQKLLKQGCWYHKLSKTFSKFYRRYYDLISKFQGGLNTLLRLGLLWIICAICVSFLSCFRVCSLLHVYCDFVTFPFGILGQVWYLIVSIPDPCWLSYFAFLCMRCDQKVLGLICFGEIH